MRRAGGRVCGRGWPECPLLHKFRSCCVSCDSVHDPPKAGLAAGCAQQQTSMLPSRAARAAGGRASGLPSQPALAGLCAGLLLGLAIGSAIGRSARLGSAGDGGGAAGAGQAADSPPPRPRLTAFVGVQVRSRSSGCRPIAWGGGAQPRAQLFLLPPPPAAAAAASSTQTTTERLTTASSTLLLLQTGFTTDLTNPKYNYEARRRALRATWFPGSRDELQR